MVPCYICGKDAAGGWIAGLPPAPDSQKTGLCPEHDNIKNRALAFKAWQDLMNLEIGFQLEAVREEREPETSFKLAIQFMDGGNTVIACRSFGVVEGTTLEVADEHGERKFYPLQHVRSYKVLG